MVFEHAKDSEALTCLNCCNSVIVVAFEWCFCTSKHNRRVEFPPLSLPGEDCYSLYTRPGEAKWKGFMFYLNHEGQSNVVEQ